MSVVTQNACKQCAPLGAALVFKGLAGAISLIHGSQGCSTYIRRYLISHFREPIDIASSSFTEETAIFGGKENLEKSIENIISQYNPQCVGIASTCLSETIGEDHQAIVSEFCREHDTGNLPEIVCVHTPSYSGTHADGFHETVLACVRHFATTNHAVSDVALFPGMVSPADIRFFKYAAGYFFHDAVIFPDYSETLDGGLWETYLPIPNGGTSLAALRKTGSVRAVIELSSTIKDFQSAGKYLQESRGIPLFRLPLPVGVRLTDQFFSVCTKLSQKDLPEVIQQERGRLLDLYIDGHKYLFSKRVLLFGDEDLVVGLFSFCQEIGLFPVLCCSGTKSSNMKSAINGLAYSDNDFETIVQDGVDFEDMKEMAAGMSIDLMIGNSKGYKVSRMLDVPMIRVGFPVHDRIGAGHILHCGYHGAALLFEKIVNVIIANSQDKNNINYGYL